MFKFILLTLMVMFSAQSHAVDIYFQTTIWSADHVMTEEIIKEAVWSWNQRLGTDHEYKGVKTSPDRVPGTIDVRIVSTAVWNALNRPAYSQAVTTHFDYLYDHYMLITIKPGYYEYGLMKHELGHALGYLTHSSDDETLMHSYIHQHFISPQDALTVRNHHLWGATSPSLCHTELSSDGYVYIPYVEGFTATLKAVNNTLILHRVSFGNEIHCGDSSNYIDDDNNVHIYDIRSIGENFSHVVLYPVGEDVWVVGEIN